MTSPPKSAEELVREAHRWCPYHPNNGMIDPKSGPRCTGKYHPSYGCPWKDGHAAIDAAVEAASLAGELKGYKAAADLMNCGHPQDCLRPTDDAPFCEWCRSLEAARREGEKDGYRRGCDDVTHLDQQTTDQAREQAAFRRGAREAAGKALNIVEEEPYISGGIITVNGAKRILERLDALRAEYADPPADDCPVCKGKCRGGFAHSETKP